MSEREFEAYLAALAKLTGLSPAQRDAIAQELRDHMESRLEALYDQGLDRDAAIDQALEEFGDANLLARNLAAPKRQALRRRLVNTSLATAALAALAVVLTTSLLPASNPGAAPPATAQQQPDTPRSDGLQAVAEPTQSDASPSQRGAGGRANRGAGGFGAADPADRQFVYVMGDSPRPGAYALPPQGLTLRQLIASAGGLPGNLPEDRIHVTVFTAGDNAPRLDAPLAELIQPGQPAPTVQADEIVTLRRLPGIGDPNVQTVVIDLTELLVLATGYEGADLYQNSWILDQQDHLIATLVENAQGMGFDSDEDLASVTCWMGVLTLVGTEPALEQVQKHIRQLHRELEERDALRQARRDEARAQEREQILEQMAMQQAEVAERRAAELRHEITTINQEITKQGLRIGDEKRALEIHRLELAQYRDNEEAKTQDDYQVQVARKQASIEGSEAELSAAIERHDQLQERRQALQAELERLSD
ncbi:MAG: permease prefix domain 1-containing protein [Planctomycetota bacterium]